jgi:hypothetical protein
MQHVDDGNENHPDDEQPNMMIAEENEATTNTNIGNGSHQSSYLAEDEKATASVEQHSDVVVDEDEDALLERQAAVQQILELFCLLGAGYWRLCQVRSYCGNLCCSILHFP